MHYAMHHCIATRLQHTILLHYAMHYCETAALCYASLYSYEIAAIQYCCIATRCIATKCICRGSRVVVVSVGLRQRRGWQCSSYISALAIACARVLWKRFSLKESGPKKPIIGKFSWRTGGQIHKSANWTHCILLMISREYYFLT
jgi:hypothetical protein